MTILTPFIAMKAILIFVLLGLIFVVLEVFEVKTPRWLQNICFLIFVLTVMFFIIWGLITV